MVDILLIYGIFAAIWAFFLDIKKKKGIIMQLGMIIFFPFVFVHLLGKKC